MTGAFSHRIRFATFCILSLAAIIAQADDPIFSGPQPGERLPALKVRGVLDEWAGKEVELVKEDDPAPIVLIFVHQVSRPVIGFTRTLSAYALTRKPDGLSTGVVWLDDDASAAESTVLRVKHALTAGVPLGVSLDGREGPGSYGLNRNVALTILVAKENKVTANFALVQPSLQVDLPKVLEQIIAVVGGPMPKLTELPGVGEMMRGPTGMDPNEMLRPLLRPLIQKEATPAQVQQAAEAIEKFVNDKPLVKAELVRIAKLIVSSGKLSNYGTTPAQEFLSKWSKVELESREKPESRNPSPNEQQHKLEKEGSKLGSQDSIKGTIQE